MTAAVRRGRGGGGNPRIPLVMAGVIAATHVGYPALAVAAGRLARRGSPATQDPPSPTHELPAMTVLVCALDEAAVIAEKVRDARAQDYPPDRLEVLVVADGSTDDTAAIAEAHGARVLWDAPRRGKSNAVNRGMAAVTTELACLTDANCTLQPGALQALARAFADPSVAVAAGAKRVRGADTHGRGEGLYWRIESAVLAAEGVFGAAMGAPGELCAVRTATFRPIPDGVINDDYHTVCDALVRHHKVVYVPEAVAVEDASASMAEEFERRSRIAAGTWQTTLQHIQLGHPGRGHVAVAFWGHRVLRSLVVPPLLPLVLLAAVRARRHPIARVLLAGQAAGYAAALVSTRRPWGPFTAAFQFAFTNGATLVGAWRHLSGRQPVAWRKARRTVQRPDAATTVEEPT